MIITKPNYQKRIDILNQVIDSGKLSAKDAKIAKNTIAGLLLEKQMAYELDIAFDKYEDILVLNDYSLMPGSVIKCRLIGVLIMEDESGMDEKLLAVPVSKVDPTYDKIKTIEDLPKHTLDKIKNFF